MIPNQRELFSIPMGVTYLNCAFTGPLLRDAQFAGEMALVSKATPWSLSHRDFVDPAEELRELFAKLVEADADGIAIIPSVSYGMAVAAKNICIKKGQKILIQAEEFPSNVYVWRELARSNDAIIETVPAPLDFNWTREILSRIDKTTAVVVCCPNHWTDGSITDLSAIRQATLSVGAKLVIDGTQSIGAVPFSANDISPDFLITALHKWLLGPYSMGLMYVAPEFRDGTPIEYNWLNRLGSDDLTKLTDYVDDYRPGARRYDVGQMSNFLCMPVAKAALKQILAWGVRNIAATLEVLVDHVAFRAAELGLGIVPKAFRSSHMTGISISGGSPKSIMNELKNSNIFVSNRGRALRVSPHLYNSVEDIDRLFNLLERVPVRGHQ